MKTRSFPQDRREAEGGSSLSVHRSFVVSLFVGCEVESNEIDGRVEHVASGEATEFRCAAELLGFFARVLGSETDKRDATVASRDTRRA